jgi:hypothetical protein
MKYLFFPLLSFFMLGVGAGCSTEPSADWGARVGRCTYEQALQKMGKPDKLIKLDGGAFAGEWLRGSEPGATVGYKGGVDAGQMDWMKPESVTIYPTGKEVGRWLRLVFGPDGELRSWENFRR